MAGLTPLFVFSLPTNAYLIQRLRGGLDTGRVMGRR